MNTRRARIGELAAASLLAVVAGVAAQTRIDVGTTTPKGASPARITFLRRGEALRRGDRVYSKNGLFFLSMQSDGNLVFYRKGPKKEHALFSTRTHRAGAWAVLQEDGNLVVYAEEHGKEKGLWASHTSGAKDVFLKVQNDGNVVIYHTKKGKVKALWASRSGGLIHRATRRSLAMPAGGSIHDIIVRAFESMGPATVAWALCIAYHESRYDPNVCYENSQSQACGLFQFEPGTWDGTPWRNDSRFNPVANAEAAAWLYRQDGPWPWATHIYCRTP